MSFWVNLWLIARMIFFINSFIYIFFSCYFIRFYFFFFLAIQTNNSQKPLEMIIQQFFVDQWMYIWRNDHTMELWTFSNDFNIFFFYLSIFIPHILIYYKKKFYCSNIYATMGCLRFIRTFYLVSIVFLRTPNIR